MRLLDFQKILAVKGVDIAVFLNASYGKKDSSIAYFTGGLDVDLGLLAIPKNKSPKLFIPGFEYDMLRDKTNIEVVRPKENLWDCLKEHFPRARVVGINADVLSVNELKGLKKRFGTVRDISNIVYDLRSVKNVEEIKNIEKSIEVTEGLFVEVLENMPFLKTEKGIADFLLKRTIDLGCEPAFPPIVASGKNASFPHHEPESVLLKGFLVIDYGVKKNGYCADITRTFYVGNPTTKEKKLYALVLKSQEFAIQKCVSGNTFEEVDTTARGMLGKHSKEFIHSIGHSLGIEVHDDIPKRKKRAKMLLKENMIVTVEPGVYVKGNFGIRIEDDVVVGIGSARNLTKLSKELRVVRSK
ncbi:aminopeptidase P family protein [Candidatus Woesearchaeota archaeon]|nr:aminopeptidase P family protein [Candidatus Woesearchaeota archaeon]